MATAVSSVIRWALCAHFRIQVQGVRAWGEVRAPLLLLPRVGVAARGVLLFDYPCTLRVLTVHTAAFLPLGVAGEFRLFGDAGSLKRLSAGVAKVVLQPEASAPRAERNTRDPAPDSRASAAAACPSFGPWRPRIAI